MDIQVFWLQDPLPKYKIVFYCSSVMEMEIPFPSEMEIY